MVNIDIGGGILLGVFCCMCFNTLKRHLVVSKPPSLLYVYTVLFGLFSENNEYPNKICAAACDFCGSGKANQTRRYRT